MRRVGSPTFTVGDYIGNKEILFLFKQEKLHGHAQFMTTLLQVARLIYKNIKFDNYLIV